MKSKLQLRFSKESFETNFFQSLTTHLKQLCCQLFVDNKCKMAMLLYGEFSFKTLTSTATNSSIFYSLWIALTLRKMLSVYWIYVTTILLYAMHTDVTKGVKNTNVEWHQVYTHLLKVQSLNCKVKTQACEKIVTITWCANNSKDN